MIKPVTVTVQQMEKFPDRLEHLTDLLFRTWSAYLAAKNLDSLLSTQHPNQNYFFTSAYWTCIESALLGFSKLMSNNKNEISIVLLVSSFDAKVVETTITHREDLLSLIEFQKDQLGELQPLVEQIKMWRDRAIAHSDKKFVFDPAMITQMAPIDMEQLGHALETLQDMINTFRKLLGMGGVRFEEAEIRMSSELKYLTQILKQRDFHR